MKSLRGQVEFYEFSLSTLQGYHQYILVPALEVEDRCLCDPQPAIFGP